MDLPPEASLQILLELLKRTPLNEAEKLGAQMAVNTIEKTNKEWRDFKNPPPPQS